MTNPDITKIKTSTITDLSQVFEKAQKQYDEVNIEIERAQKQLAELTNQYVTISKDIEVDKEKLVAENRKLNNARNILENDTANFQSDKNAFEAKKLSINAQVDTLTKTRDQLKSEIDSIKAEIESSKTLTGIKATLLSEIEELNNTIAMKRDAIALAEKSQSSILKEFETNKSLISAEIEAVKKAVDEQKSIVLPKLNEIEDREKAVAKREADVEIIVNRYKKLYADQGAGFTI